jgi:hypothetical protein
MTEIEKLEGSPARRRLRRLVKWVSIVSGVVVALLVIAVAVVVVTEWTYLDRMLHHPADLITNVGWYVPKGRGPARGCQELVGASGRAR